MKTKKKFIFTMVFLPAVMLSSIGSGPFGPLTCGPGPTMDVWEATLEEFENGAASRNPPKDTGSANSGGIIVVELQTPTEDDKLDASCFGRIAKVLTDNANKKFDIDMRNCEFKNSADTVVPEGVFENCKGQLVGLDLPSQITCIGKRAFAGFTALGEVRIGAQIKEIGDEAYKDCTMWRIVIYYIPNTMGKNVFDGWTDKQRIYVPFERGSSPPSGWDPDWYAGCNAVIKYKGEY